MIWKNVLYKSHGFIVPHHSFRNYLAEGCIFTMTHSALFWYLDFEGYQVDGTFYVKEISILKNDRTQCWTYYITQQDIAAPTSFEFLRHAAQLKLEWCFGDYRLEEAINAIKEVVGDESVYFCTRNSTYDTDKYEFFKNFLPQLTEQHYEVGYNMVNCINDKCDVDHNFCARQRVHELRFYDYHNLLL